MKFKCIHCGERKLNEVKFDEELHCSHAVCSECGATLAVWYDENNEKVTLIEDEEYAESGVVYLDDITGTIGEWLDGDLRDIPSEAVQYLQKAYEICANEFEKENK